MSQRTPLSFKRLALTAAVALCPLSALAGQGGRLAYGSTYAEARVVEVVPVYERVRHDVPEEVCASEPVPVDRHAGGSSVAPIVGALIGGAIGNAVGHEKRNKQVGAVAGAVLGGAIGYDVSRRGRSDSASYRYEQVCRVEHAYREEERVSHYEVSYRYGDEVYTTTLPYDPGDRLRVRVSVTPVDVGHDGRHDQHAYNRGRNYWR